MATHHHAEHEQRSRSLIHPDNADEAVEHQTASSSYPARDRPSNVLPSDTTQYPRVPQTETRVGENKPDSQEDSTSGSFETIGTDIIPGGTKLTKKAKPALVSVDLLLFSTKFTTHFCSYTEHCVAWINRFS